MTHLSPLRYFATVTPPPAPLVAVLAILAGGAFALEAVSAGSSDWVLASIALVQLFACSSGFTRHASRGYYDPVLKGGGARARIALAHFAVSALPGFAAWIAAGIAGAAAAGSLSTPAFRPAGWAGLLLVSAIPWAANVRLAPFAAGSLWLLVGASFLLSGKLFRALSLLHGDPGWGRSHPWSAIAFGLGFPAVVPSLTWPAPVLGAFIGLSLAALAAGVATIRSATF
ncbi:MAG: hypothetical protein ABI610_08390, partial [Acidobacteriota bacterium]